MFQTTVISKNRRRLWRRYNYQAATLQFLQRKTIFFSRAIECSSTLENKTSKVMILLTASGGEWSGFWECKQVSWSQTFTHGLTKRILQCESVDLCGCGGIFLWGVGVITHCNVMTLLIFKPSTAAWPEVIVSVGPTVPTLHARAWAHALTVSATHSSISDRLRVQTVLQVRSMQVSKTGTIWKVRGAATASRCLRKHNMDLEICWPTNATTSAKSHASYSINRHYIWNLWLVKHVNCQCWIESEM